MERVPEPELMDDLAQARAYALADFEEPHQRFVELCRDAFPGHVFAGAVLDLGCGPADISLRFARAFPQAHIDGVDGAPAMLHFGQQAIEAAALGGRVRLIEGHLPGAKLPQRRYDAVISNSLLHHLADPAVLWQSMLDHAAPGAPLFVMDLIRPQSIAAAGAMVETYAAGEPELLRHDFYHSLLAAYTVDEVRAQLGAAGLPLEVRAASDRHLIAWGRVAAP